ncbi:MAG: MFS transporter [Euryarchaeota archaeon]|nr:MFS transporter [Euryarchaeota archaeon]
MPEKKKPGKWGVLTMMCFAMFIMTIDTTMMNVSISALVADLHTTVEGIQLAIALYALVMAAFMIIGAKIADFWGTKKTFTVGLIIYGVGTTVATLSPNLLVLLIGWSILEGIGAAMMMPVTVTYLTKEYEGKDRAFAFGVWGGIAGAAAAFGPIIGGFFTTYITWRLGFGMEAFIVVGMLAKMNILRDYPPTKKLKFDLPGAILSATGLFFVTLSILMINPLGEAPVLAVMTLGILILLLFVHRERKLARSGGDPLVHMHLFRSRVFTVGNLVSIFFQITLAGIMFTIPVFLQTVAGYNAMDTGLALMPLSVSMLVFSIYGQKLLKYLTPKHIIQVGIVMAFIGLYLLMTEFSVYSTGLTLAPGMVFYGIGLGLIFSQITNLAMSGASKSEEAEASGVFNSQKQLGMSLGTAFIGAVLIMGMINSITRMVQSQYPEVSKQQVIDWILRIKQGEIQIPPEYLPQINHLTNIALAEAMRSAMMFMMLSLIIGGVLSFFLPGTKNRKK